MKLSQQRKATLFHHSSKILYYISVNVWVSAAFSHKALQLQLIHNTIDSFFLLVIPLHVSKL